VNRNLDSLFRVFDRDGYQTLFMHPGDAWFYNRENVYRWLGAQKELFAADMENPASARAAGSRTTIWPARSSSRIRGGGAAAQTPLFSCTVTIQNHMSYTADKYGPGYVFPPVQTSAGLSDEVRTMLSRLY
jgi:phosphoglycerol transferase MdoB-like AlkP superfamily enzyme